LDLAEHSVQRRRGRPTERKREAVCERGRPLSLGHISQTSNDGMKGGHVMQCHRVVERNVSEGVSEGMSCLDASERCQRRCGTGQNGRAGDIKGEGVALRIPATGSQQSPRYFTR
jgi:hypothetical protein